MNSNLFTGQKSFSPIFTLTLGISVLFCTGAKASLTWEQEHDRQQYEAQNPANGQAFDGQVTQAREAVVVAVDSYNKVLEQQGQQGAMAEYKAALQAAAEYLKVLQFGQQAAIDISPEDLVATFLQEQKNNGWYCASSEDDMPELDNDRSSSTPMCLKPLFKSELDIMRKLKRERELQLVPRKRSLEEVRKKLQDLKATKTQINTILGIFSGQGLDGSLGKNFGELVGFVQNLSTDFMDLVTDLKILSIVTEGFAKKTTSLINSFSSYLPGELPADQEFYLTKGINEELDQVIGKLELAVQEEIDLLALQKELCDRADGYNSDEDSDEEIYFDIENDNSGEAIKAQMIAKKAAVEENLAELATRYKEANSEEQKKKIVRAIKHQTTLLEKITYNLYKLIFQEDPNWLVVDVKNDEELFEDAGCVVQ